ncbi:hypothetical protein LY90DRAFT_518792 [Neocallimastix californiae]|uniref:Uncharacterized protein n=1 Tax=Neocallimastix californiae TaxID=1754190 RepID=A0A1Y1ZI52_9FUNG|nr:hypothetical protein LY90DRAFT_518792 [Neocallimastix californiae]|eukprot:ORY09938.1 hypothetical protein LY90DRAFT_518792 [Neocallimastix californiae]
MGILALVDNKEARCILKGYGENNLVNRSFLKKYILNHCIDDSSITGITKLIILNLTIGGVQKNVIFRVVEKENLFYDVKESKNNFKDSANIKKNQNNNIEINSIVKINITNYMENINFNNNDIIENSENIINKRNSNKNIKEIININEPLKVELINNRTNKSITPCLVMESNVIINKNSKINNIQIIPNDNKNKQFINKVYSLNNNINIKERKLLIKILR